LRRGTVFFEDKGGNPRHFLLIVVVSIILIWSPKIFASPLDLSLAENVDLEAIASQKSQEEITQEADEILEELAAIEGVSVKKKVKVSFVDREFFERYYLSHLQTQYPPQEKDAYETAFQALGLLGKGEDLFTSYLKVFLSVVKGLYDPESKTLYLLKGASSTEQERVLAHELVHAIQDQQFNLTAYLKAGQGLTMDEQYARTSLMEGEAEGLSLDWKLRDEGNDFTRMGDIAPWVEQEKIFEVEGLKAFGKRVVSTDAINFPYVYGITFFQRWVRLKGWKSVDEIYRNPPRTTQQIMDFKSYFPFARSYVRVKLSDLSESFLNGYRLIWSNSLGEYGWETVLRNYLSAEEAAKAVAGWEGDGVQVYSGVHNSCHLLICFLVFHDENASNLFFKAAKSCWAKKLKIQDWIRSDDSIDWAALIDTKEVYLERFGRRVVWLEEVPEGLTVPIRSSLWDFQRLNKTPISKVQTGFSSP
jgi:hypothetical protein